MKIIPKLTEDELQLLTSIRVISGTRGYMAVTYNNIIVSRIEALVKKGVVLFIEETDSGYRRYKENHENNITSK